MPGSNDKTTLAMLQHVVPDSNQKHLPNAQVISKPGATVEMRGALSVTEGVTDLSLGADVFSTATSDAVAINATAAANSRGTVIQPGNSFVSDVMVVFESVITTAGNSGDDLDFSMGTAAGGEELIVAKALLDDGGSAVTAPKDIPLRVIAGGVGALANAHAPLGLATSEAFTLVAGSLVNSSADVRTLHFEFTPLANNLAATGNAKVIVNFRKLGYSA